MLASLNVSAEDRFGPLLENVREILWHLDLLEKTGEGSVVGVSEGTSI